MDWTGLRIILSRSEGFESWIVFQNFRVGFFLIRQGEDALHEIIFSKFLLDASCKKKYILEQKPNGTGYTDVLNACCCEGMSNMILKWCGVDRGSFSKDICDMPEDKRLSRSNTLSSFMVTSDEFSFFSTENLSGNQWSATRERSYWQLKISQINGNVV